ncbi:hypothetical protein CDAR_289611 [Caerostris darwini]|uniref:Uncharacterized protein n=1 Tax=Caerostris darwini TaxID=1538125 RepID=A0AAV4WZE7_9ARAC|nr:hypothetical protein CDAR_289611 [Caerostris darwini]
MCLQASGFDFPVDIAFLTGARLPPVSFRSSFIGPYQLEAPGLWQLLCGIGCQNDLHEMSDLVGATVLSGRLFPSPHTLDIILHKERDGVGLESIKMQGPEFDHPWSQRVEAHLHFTEGWKTHGKNARG